MAGVLGSADLISSNAALMNATSIAPLTVNDCSQECVLENCQVEVNGQSVKRTDLNYNTCFNDQFKSCRAQLQCAPLPPNIATSNPLTGSRLVERAKGRDVIAF